MKSIVVMILLALAATCPAAIKFGKATTNTDVVVESAGQTLIEGLTLVSVVGTTTNLYPISDDIQAQVDAIAQSTVPVDLSDYTWVTNDGKITLTSLNIYRTGSVTLPSFINGLPVVSIGENFCFNGMVQSVVFPDSVTNISQTAFYFASNLTNVTLPSGLLTIGAAAFYRCAISRAVFPRTLIAIGAEAFTHNLGSDEAMYFEGDAPAQNGDTFSSDHATVYYINGRTGFDASWLATSHATNMTTYAPENYGGGQFLTGITAAQVGAVSNTDSRLSGGLPAYQFSYAPTQYVGPNEAWFAGYTGEFQQVFIPSNVLPGQTFFISGLYDAGWTIAPDAGKTVQVDSVVSAISISVTGAHPSAIFVAASNLYYAINHWGTYKPYGVFEFGVITNYAENGTNYTAYIFQKSGSFTARTALNCDVLCVAGGGGGASGGGGAGGMILTNVSLTAGSYPVEVGSGGVGGIGYGASTPISENGTDSTFFGMTAIGGGCGSLSPDDQVSVAGDGGSGGGGGYAASYVSLGGDGTEGQGFAGGGNDGIGDFPYPSGGGGGAGFIGGDATDLNTPGLGGVGLACSLSGSELVYATGGDGATYGVANAPDDATPNTGNGGDAASLNEIGGMGGSGVVIIRYAN